MSFKKRGKRKLVLWGTFFITLGIICYIVNFFVAYKPSKITLQAPFNLGLYEFNRNTLSEKELDIAWKLYVQLSTRKAAIPFDENNDIVVEIYSSWYQLFQSTREYLIEMPASELQGNRNAQQIVNMTLEVLNQGLRPHLTEWQGKYRRWYESAVQNDQYDKLTPQQIQRKYPEYEEMVKDIKRVNQELLHYATQLKKFAYEEPPGFIESNMNKIWIKISKNKKESQL